MNINELFQNGTSVKSSNYPIHDRSAAIISVCCQLLGTLVSVSPFFSLPIFSFAITRIFCCKLKNPYRWEMDFDHNKKLFRLSTVFALSVTAMISRQYAYEPDFQTVAAALSIMNFKGLTEYLTNLGKQMSNVDKEKGLIALGLANYVCAISDAVSLAWHGNYACNYYEHKLLGIVTLLSLISSFHLQLLFLAVGLDISRKDNWNGTETRVGLFQNTLGMMVGIYNTMASYSSFAKSSSQGSLVPRFGSVLSDVGLPLDRNASADLQQPVRNYDHVEAPLIPSDDHFIVGVEEDIPGTGSKKRRTRWVVRFGACLYDALTTFMRAMRFVCGLIVEFETDIDNDTMSVIEPEESNLAFFIVDFFALSKSITVCITLVFLSTVSVRLFRIYSIPCVDKRVVYLIAGGLLGLLDLMLILKESTIFRSAPFRKAHKQERAIVWECTYFVWTHGIIVCIAVACNEYAFMIPS